MGEFHQGPVSLEASKFSTSLTSFIPISAPSLSFSYQQFIVLIQLMAIHLLREEESRKAVVFVMDIRFASVLNSTEQ